MGKLRYLAFAALAAGPLAGMSSSSALAGACSIAPVSTYTAISFSCNVGPVTFSNMSISTAVSGSGAVSLGNISPFTTIYNGNTEYGLDLTYSASTGFSGGTADVSWIYNVSGVPALTDAYAELAGGVIGQAAIVMNESLSNGVTLQLTSAGVAWTSFPPFVGNLHVIKDQQDLAAPGAVAFSSILGNAFSVSSVPEPSTWAMMALGFAGLGYAGFHRGRKTATSIAL